MKQKWAASARKGAFFGQIRSTLESEAKQLERRIIDGCREAILASSEHFSGIYGASSANGRPTRSPAFRFSLMESKPGKVQIVKMALERL